MDEQQFQKSVQLFNLLGEAKLRSGKNLWTELCLDQEISLWEVVASYIVLYRFPLLFSRNDTQPTWHDQIKYFFRPYRGLVARFRDSIVSPIRRKAITCKNWPQGDLTVLFLGFMPTFYRDVLRPVAESLAKRKGIEIVVIGQTGNPPAGVLSNESVKFQSFQEHWDDYTEKLTKDMLIRLHTFQKILLNRTQLKAVIQNTIDDFGHFALRREFLWLFWREFKRLIPQIAVAKHILENHHPALIISADDADQRCRIYSLLARQKGIPSLLIQQGLTSKKYPEWVFYTHSAIAAMGEISREDMILQGVPPDKIFVTGHPGFDHLASSDVEAYVRLRNDLGLTNGEKMVLLASQPYWVGAFKTAHIRCVMIRAIAQAVLSLKNIKLIVKPHPGEVVRELKRLIGKTPRAVMADKTKDISHLIKACDVFVTFFSTSALQAIYAGKPVINVDFPNSGGQSLYSASGATWIARSTEEIVTHIRNLTSESRNKEIASREVARQRFLCNMVYLPDGQATERVLKVILNMLQL